MPKKGSLLRKQFCSVIVTGLTLLGLYACNSSPPNTTQPPDTVQQPVVVQPGTGTSIATPKPVSNTVALGTIRGQKYLDQDGNRQYGMNDKPITGWSIYLYPGTAMQSNAWTTPLAAATTDSSGNFSFTGLQSGTYLVASAATGQNGERLQQISPLSTPQAQCVTLPTQAQSYCEPVAYQVTINTPCTQPCDLSFIDYGAYGGYGGYGGYGDYPGYGYPYGWPIGCLEPIFIPDVEDEEDICDVEPIALRSASRFAILAGTAVTNTGSTVVTGDVGVSPGSTFVGFPPGTVYGSVFLADATASQAKNDLATAINNGFGRLCPETIRNGNLTGKTLLPGVYKAEGSNLTLDSNGTLILNANGCGSEAVWIFQANGNLTVGSSARVVLANGARASNVFWVIGNSAMIGTGSLFVGSILAQQSITLQNGVNLQGRALALVSSVTLDTDIVNRPSSN